MKKKKKKILILNYSNKQLLDNQFFQINKKNFTEKVNKLGFDWVDQVEGHRDGAASLPALG